MRKILDENEAFVAAMPEGSAYIASGVGTGIFGATVSHPFDTIKTKMQAFIEPKHPRHKDFSSIPRTVATIFREEGAQAFFLGLGPRALRISCVTLLVPIILSFIRCLQLSMSTWQIMPIFIIYPVGCMCGDSQTLPGLLVQTSCMAATGSSIHCLCPLMPYIERDYCSDRSQIKASGVSCPRGQHVP